MFLTFIPNFTLPREPKHLALESTLSKIAYDASEIVVDENVHGLTKSDQQRISYCAE
jgi:hypothetical protein